MKAKRSAAVRGEEPRRKSRQSGARNAQHRPGDAPPRRRKPTREQRPQRSAPQTNPIPRPADGPVRPKNASQAKARAKARKAKAPKVVRPPLRERLLVRLASIDLNPRTLVARVPFVVLVIGSLGVGLGVTLWLSTDAAERSYQLGSARETNQALLQQKEALERDVLEAQAAPALAEAARNLGMIPSRDTAHLVQDAASNWIVVGTPKPAEGVSPPPLNSPLPEDGPPAPPPPPAPRVVEPREVTVRMPARGAPTPAPLPGAELSVPVAPAAPLAEVPGAEVPHAIPGQTPALGPIPPLAEQPSAAPAEQPAAPLDAQPPAPVVAPPPGAPA
jgi:hypothetical protein